MSAQTIQPLRAALTAHDRCDRCGAQAYMRVTLLEGDLLFCGHHGREHKDQLELTALDIQDETDKLDPQK